MFRIKIPKIAYLILLFLIMVITRLDWFNPTSILYSGDWQFRYDYFVQQNWKSWLTWTSFDNVGSYNVQLYNYPIRGVLWSIITLLGFSYDFAVKVSILWPMSIISFFGTFLLGRRFFKNNLFAFVSTLFYNSTTYFLIMQTRHLFIAIIYAFLPFYVYLFDRSLRKNRLVDWLIFSLFFSIGIFYELRMMFITVFVLFLYFLFNFKYGNWEKNKDYYLEFFKNVIISGFVVFFVNLFWILPLILIKDNNLEDTAGRPIFGDHLFTMKQAIAIFRWSWTGGFEDRGFSIQPIEPYLFIPPIIAFIGFFSIGTFGLKYKHKQYFLFGSIITVIGIFLTKQSDRPLEWFYKWAYENLPGFEVFREASKFYTITALGYFSLIGLTLSFLYKNLRSKSKLIVNIVAFVLIITSFLNFKPFITKEIDSLFVSREVPEDYQKLADYLESQDDDFKVAWIPHAMVYGYYNWNKSRHSFIYFPKNGWDHLDYSDLANKETKDAILDIIEKPYSNNIFDNLNIKYIVLPTRVVENYNDVYQGRGGEIDEKDLNIYNYYQKRLDKIDYLEKVDIGANEFSLYKNNSYKAKISSLDNVFVTDKKIEETFDLISKNSNSFTYLNNKDYDKNNENFSFAESLVNNFNSKNLLKENIIKYNYQPNSNKNNSIQYENNIFEVFAYLDKESQEIVIQSQPLKNLYLNDKQSFVINEPQEHRIPIETQQGEKEFYLKNSSTFLQKIDEKNKFLGFFKREEELEISYLYKNQNLISNPSFEEGTWDKEVKDCHDYDKNPDIEMNLVNGLDGGNALNLISRTHIACSYQRIILPEKQEEVEDTGDYLVKYDFLTDNIQNTSQVNITSDYESVTVTGKTNNANEWKNHSSILNLKHQGVSSIFTVYATPQKSSVSYDNLSLQKIYSKKKLILDDIVNSEIDTEIFEIPNYINNIKIDLKNYDIKNLISNPSFEEGTWGKEVKDCHNYDENPDIETNLISEQNRGNVLELTSRRHVACTNQIIDLEKIGNVKYLLEFDYYFDGADVVRVRYNYNDPEKTIVSKNIYQESREKLEPKKWYTHREFLEIPKGATTLDLRLESVTYTKPKVSEVNTRFDNFNLLALPDISSDYLFLSKPKKDFSPAEVDFNFINSTEYDVEIKNATLDEKYSGKVALQMSERFNDSWILKRKSGNSLFWLRFLFNYKDLYDFNLEHIKSSSNLNLWLIDIKDFCDNNPENCTFNKDGTVNMNFSIVFAGEKYFRITFLFSSLIFLAILLIIFLNIKNKLYLQILNLKNSIYEFIQRIIFFIKNLFSVRIKIYKPKAKKLESRESWLESDFKNNNSKHNSKKDYLKKHFKKNTKPSSTSVKIDDDFF